MRTVVIAFLGLVAAAALASPVPAQSVRKQPSPKVEAAIRTVIEAQRDAWNRGDIAGYMDGYARSADTIFISGDSVTHGWQTVLERYRKGYDTREKMGVLTFSDLEFNALSRDAVAVSGRWHLQRSQDEPHGRFTLIFRRTKAGWRIVHDHTSSA
jgi:ketosteroid isomerase-like protein